MTARPSLSKGELEVARILWDIGPATVREIHDACPAERKLDFSTVQTYLRRLETKGHASSKLEGRIRIYAARTKPKTVIRQTVNDLVQRLFAGDKMPLVRHLIEDQDISSEDFAEIRRLLSDLEQQRKERS